MYITQYIVHEHVRQTLAYPIYIFCLQNALSNAADKSTSNGFRSYIYINKYKYNIKYKQ